MNMLWLLSADSPYFDALVRAPARPSAPLPLLRDEADFRRRGKPCVQTLQTVDRLMARIPNMALTEAIDVHPRELRLGGDLRN